MTSITQNRLIAVAFFSLSLTLGFATIEHYGVMNDAPIKYASGFRNYYFLATGDSNYLDPEKMPQLAQKQGLTDHHKFLNSDSFSPVDYSPLFDALSVLTCNLFYQTLGWLSYFDAHNSIIIILFAVFCGLFYRFAVLICGNFGGLLASVLFALFPRLLAHSHNNLSDIPLVFFYFVTISVSYLVVQRKDSRGILLVAFLYGLTVATKLNGAFLIFILIPWYTVHKILNRNPLTQKEKIAWAVSPFIFYFGWILPFPWFWTASSIPEFFSRQINSHIFTMLAHEDIVGYGTGWNLSIFSQAIATTPTICIFFFIPGFIVSFRRFLKDRDATFVLLSLWLFVPIFKSGLPGIKNYEMIRHFMEYIPALILFCGIGVEWVLECFTKINYLRNFLYRVKLFGSIVLVFLAAVPVYRIHPYEILYFNNISGGLQGAQTKFMYAYDYWQTSLREMIEWLNLNARKGASVSTVSFFDYNVMEPVILRKDLVKLSPLQGDKLKVNMNFPGRGNLNTEMFRYKIKGYLVQLIKRHDNSDLRMFLSIPVLKPEFEVVVEGRTIGRVFYVEEDIGIIRQYDKILIVHFDKNGLAHGLTSLQSDEMALHY